MVARSKLTKSHVRQVRQRSALRISLCRVFPLSSPVIGYAWSPWSPLILRQQFIPQLFKFNGGLHSAFSTKKRNHTPPNQYNSLVLRHQCSE